MPGMFSYSKAAVERAMKVQEVMLRAWAKKITWWQAAEILGISDRHRRRIREGYEKFGLNKYGAEKESCMRKNFPGPSLMAERATKSPRDSTLFGTYLESCDFEGDDARVVGLLLDSCESTSNAAWSHTRGSFSISWCGLLKTRANHR